uniref:Uncharacterized protein n=1 Tax=Timema bartmani TaxID=61472 RepID=A0A7R9EQ58_9NEOP|nr:unnamed protein product [Timema bartmani]
MNFKKNDAAAPRSPGGGATLVAKTTAILAENAQEEDPGRRPSQVQAEVTFSKEPKVSSACKSLITRILAPARSRLKITAIRNDLWFTLTSDVTRSLSSEDSLDSGATSSRNDSLEQTSVIQPLLTKEGLKTVASKPRPDGGNTTDEEQHIRSVKPPEPHLYKY